MGLLLTAKTCLRLSLGAANLALAVFLLAGAAFAHNSRLAAQSQRWKFRKI